jgi:hypothetical protein
MDFAKQIEYNRRLLVEDIFRRLEAALRPVVDALNDFFAVLFSSRLPANWREQWRALIAEQEAAGYRIDPRIVREFEDWIEAWARYCELLPTVAEPQAVSPTAAEPPPVIRRPLPRPTQTQIHEQFFDQKLADAQRSLDEIKLLLNELGGRLDAGKLDETVDVDADVDRCEALIWRYNDSLISARGAWLRDDLSGDANVRLLQMLMPATFGLPLFADEQQAQEAMRQERQSSQRLGQRNVTMNRVVFGMKAVEWIGYGAGFLAGGGVLYTAYQKGGRWGVIEALAVIAAGAAAEQGVEAGMRAAGASEETIRGARLAAAVIAFILLRRKNLAAAKAETPSPSKPATTTQGVTQTAPAAGETIADRGVWDLGPVVRGEILHERFGQNLPKSFPVVDKFIRGIVTSIKSIDLRAPSYRKPEALRRTCEGFVDKVAGFKSGRRGKVRILESEIEGRALDILVPPGATSERLGVLGELSSFGQAKGVLVTIIEVAQ